MYNTGTLIKKSTSHRFVHSNKVVVWKLLDGILFNNKQLLDEVIIKVEVGVISRSLRLRLITLTETLIIQSGYHKNRI